jgi:hypothetical protein
MTLQVQVRQAPYTDPGDRRTQTVVPRVSSHGIRGIPGVTLAEWSDPHGSGHTEIGVYVQHKDIPDLVRLLLDVYIQGEAIEANQLIDQIRRRQS